MTRLYLKSMRLLEILLFLCPILLIPIMIGDKLNFEDTLKYTHYITLVPNTIFLIFSYIQYSKIQKMYALITTRITSFKVLWYSAQFAIINVLAYSLLLYGFICLSIHTVPTFTKSILLLISINTICYLMEQIIMLFQIDAKKNILYIILPVLINFLFHYAFVPLYLK